MVTMDGAPVGWAMLMHDLDNAKEDLDRHGGNAERS